MLVKMHGKCKKESAIPIKYYSAKWEKKEGLKEKKKGHFCADNHYFHLF